MESSSARCFPSTSPVRATLTRTEPVPSSLHSPSATSALIKTYTRSRECLYTVWESNPDEYYKVDEDGEGAEGQQPESADGMDTKA